jgi:hypothetical protein
MSHGNRPAFRVDGYIDIASRGTFVEGEVSLGAWSLGMRVVAADGSAFTVGAIEVVDRPEGQHSVALGFSEHPTRDRLERLFPKGSLFVAHATGARNAAEAD